jgi:hypothetical protein
VRLGVDIAADGGDEFSIDRCVGDVVHPLHRSSARRTAPGRRRREGPRAHPRRRTAREGAIGSPRRVRVKVDKNGLGHGAVGMLERWPKIGRHHAEIVGVMVSESPERDDPGARAAAEPETRRAVDLDAAAPAA